MVLVSEKVRGVGSWAGSLSDLSGNSTDNPVLPSQNKIPLYVILLVAKVRTVLFYYPQ